MGTYIFLGRQFHDHERGELRLMDVIPRAWDVNHDFSRWTRLSPRQDSCFLSLLPFLRNGLWQRSARSRFSRFNARLFYVNLHTQFFVHADFFPSFRPETHRPAPTATAIHSPTLHPEDGPAITRVHAAKNSRGLQYNKYNNNNVYLLLHLYFTLFRLWLTNRYLIVVRTALVFSFLPFFQLLFVPFEKKPPFQELFEKTLLLRPVFPSLFLF